MNPAVLRWNNNYPFKTTPHYVWYIALSDSGEVTAFMPLKKLATGIRIDNYYVAGEERTLFDALIDRIIADMGSKPLWAMVHKRHSAVFADHSFAVAQALVRYDKMLYTPRPAHQEPTTV